ncbi:hypothetical protein BOX15_Mlig013015g1 [Macrostomum lignano]|nr:hypothetical protein BOX15_Mlig013015g1 [Macrostomum lignano]
MTSPPYSPDGKPCRHAGCGQPVCHERFRTSAKVLESRWAAQQAKERELAEVADFFN